jgi:hypothetical protein
VIRISSIESELADRQPASAVAVGSKDRTIYEDPYHVLLNDVGKGSVLAEIRRGWIE